MDASDVASTLWIKEIFTHILDLGQYLCLSVDISPVLWL